MAERASQDKKEVLFSETSQFSSMAIPGGKFRKEDTGEIGEGKTDGKNWDERQ